jgi:hypothetical protein
MPIRKDYVRGEFIVGGNFAADGLRIKEARELRQEQPVPPVMVKTPLPPPRFAELDERLERIKKQIAELAERVRRR